jgi:hypothetical protein
MDIPTDQSADPVVMSQNPLPREPEEFQLPESERKRAKMAAQLQSIQRFIVMISKGLMKIVEDMSSHLLKR